jgi:hypothetical protein
MAKRISDEERVLAFFKTAPLAKVEVVFNLAKSEVKDRQKNEGSSEATKKPRTPRKPATPAEGGSARVETVSSTKGGQAAA